MPSFSKFADFEKYLNQKINKAVEESCKRILDELQKIIVEEFYDKENPRFELELFGESSFSVSYSVIEKEKPDQKRLYSSLKKSVNTSEFNNKKTKESSVNTNINKCSICNSILKNNNYIKADKGKTLICKSCFNKLF